MAANYAKFIGQVGWMQVFNKFHLFNVFEFFTLLLYNIKNKNSEERSKIYIGVAVARRLLVVNDLGPVVQSVVSLTSSLRIISLTVLAVPYTLF